jgi:hypothetical protein
VFNLACEMPPLDISVGVKLEHKSTIYREVARVVI